MFSWEIFVAVLGGGIGFSMILLIAIFAGYLYSDGRFILGTAVGFFNLLWVATVFGFVG